MNQNQSTIMTESVATVFANARPFPPAKVEIRPVHQVNRLQWADFVRGAAIFGVVYIHGSFTFLSARAAPLIPQASFTWCVPVFVILTAFFAKRAANESETLTFRAYVKQAGKRLKRLLPPFIAWSSFYILLRNDWHGIGLARIVSRYFSGYGWSGQYFLIILIQLAVIFPLLCRIRIGLSSCIIAFCAHLAASIILPGLFRNEDLMRKMLDDRCALFWMSYAMFGIYLARTNLMSRQVTARRVAVSLMVLVLGIGLTTEDPRISELMSSARPWAAYQHPMIIIASPFIFMSLVTLGVALHGKLMEVVAAVGRYSLGVFCLNPLVIIVLSKISVQVAANREMCLVLPLLAAAFITLTCYLLSILLANLGLSFLVR